MSTVLVRGLVFGPIVRVRYRLIVLVLVQYRSWMVKACVFQAHAHSYSYELQIMLCGGPVATPRSRDFFVNYPVSFSLRYLYIRPISRHVCVSVCMSVITGRRSFVREFG